MIDFLRYACAGFLMILAVVFAAGLVVAIVFLLQPALHMRSGSLGPGRLFALCFVLGSASVAALYALLR